MSPTRDGDKTIERQYDIPVNHLNLHHNFLDSVGWLDGVRDMLGVAVFEVQTWDDGLQRLVLHRCRLLLDVPGNATQNIRSTRWSSILPPLHFSRCAPLHSIRCSDTQ